MQNHLKDIGPMSGALDAWMLQTYKSGVISAAACGSNTQSHAIQLVGVDLSQGFFKIRNSWSAAWGEGGYFRIETKVGTTVNACNIAGAFCPKGYYCPTGASYTTMAAVKKGVQAHDAGLAEGQKEEKKEAKKVEKKEAKKVEKKEAKKVEKKEAKKVEKKEAKKVEKKEAKKVEKKEAKKTEKKEANKQGKKEVKKEKKGKGK